MNNCPICCYGAFKHGELDPDHSAQCPHATIDDLRKHYQKAVLSVEAAGRNGFKGWKRAQFWEGKCSVLRHENNKLRAKLYPKKAKP